MQRIIEPELMNDSEQAIAYAAANFEKAHQAIVDYFPYLFPNMDHMLSILDLGCGTADITIRFAKMLPNCKIDAVDGASEMLNQARYLIAQKELQDQITLHLQNLTDCDLSNKHYNAIVSNSLLHHLHNAQHLWSVVKKHASPTTAVFISDLFRPETIQSAKILLQQYASDEPAVLRRDFFNSLLAAFSIEEVRTQLEEAEIKGLNIEQISDRHMLIHGCIQ